MELKDHMTYEVLHEVVITTLKDKDIVLTDEDLLKRTGIWLYRSYLYELNELKLKLPFYERSLLEQVIEYFYHFDLLIKILSSGAFTTNDLALFDVRRYRSADNYTRKNKDFSIDFLRTERGVHHFKNNVVVSTDRFIPVFRSEEIGSNKDGLNDIFPLFKIIAESDLFGKMTLIELSRKMLSVMTTSYAIQGPRIRTKQLTYAALRDDHDLREAAVLDLQNTDIDRNFIFRYPYHTNIDSVLTDNLKSSVKKLDLELSHRFSYEEIGPDEIIITRNEAKGRSDRSIFDLAERFKIFQTTADASFANKLRSFLDDWRTNRTNIFNMPIPVKWFMYIHRGESLNEWQMRFRVDFPQASGKLLNDALHLIELFYQLDWTGLLINEKRSMSILLPRTYITREVAQSLRNHLTNILIDVAFIDEDHAQEKDKELWLMDPFNIVLINNLKDGWKSEQVSFIVPDILYYIYRPFIKYQVVKYPFHALLSDRRQVLDPDYTDYMDFWNERSTLLLDALKKELRTYEIRLGLDLKLDVPDTDEEDIADLSKAEVISSLTRKETQLRRDITGTLKITTCKGEKLVLRKNAPVLIERNGHVMRTLASLLEPGSRFLPVQDIVNNIGTSTLVDRMLSISTASLNWCEGLFELKKLNEHLYLNMKSDGLSVGQTTFDHDYAAASVSPDNFHMPRSRNDWKIVCDTLSLTDGEAAWMAHRCREDVNRLKKAYADIIELLVSTGSFGVNIDDDIIETVAVILSTLPNAETDRRGRKGNAMAILNEINNNILLGQVDQIEEGA